MLLVVPSEPRREGPSLRTSDTSIETLFDASSDVYADSECTTNHLLTTVSTEEWKALGKTHHQSTSQARSGRSTWKIASLFATPSAAENKPRSPLFQSEIASQKSTRRPSWTKFNEIPSGLVRLFKRCTLSRTSRQKTAIAPDLDDDVLFDLRRDPETVQGLSAPHIQAEAMSTAVPAGGWAEHDRPIKLGCFNQAMAATLLPQRHPIHHLLAPLKATSQAAQSFLHQHSHLLCQHNQESRVGSLISMGNLGIPTLTENSTRVTGSTLIACQMVK
ncbi:hypothetical protein BSLG_001445 [Batrachochytrium salamandrivorans]|nr:hypothetical protein BSLG_001445 [Batrachochytrium salamandrivorans]